MTTSTTGVSGGDDCFEQLLLASEQPEIVTVAELAGGGVIGQSGPLGDEHDGHLGVARDGHGLRDRRVVAAVEASAELVCDVAAGKPLAHGVEDRRAPDQFVFRDDVMPVAGDAERVVRLAHLDRVSTWTRWL